MNRLTDKVGHKEYQNKIGDKRDRDETQEDIKIQRENIIKMENKAKSNLGEYSFKKKL